ncbi:hypothetical protein C2E31_17605 [Rhodopirellula baltica]|nr:hypothetical protein C2E31_17605 [Rhodopirellula baltica]
MAWYEGTRAGDHARKPRCRIRRSNHGRVGGGAKKKQPLQRLSVVDVLRSGVQEVPDRPAVGYRDADGTWQTLTWTQYHDQVLAIANQLLRAGVTAGDKVAIIGRSTVGWGVAEMATYCLQAVVVGLDANSSAAAIQSAGDAVDLSAIVVIGDPVKDFDYSRFGIELLLMDEAGGLVNEPNTGSDHAAGQELATLPQVSGETPATIVFTSGTTGIPKALQYTHRQMVLAINEIDREYPIINEGDSTICWLPMNHLFQRMTNLVSMLQHATIYFEPDPRQLAQTAQAVNPKVLFAVPRFLEKVAESIDEGFKKLPPPLAKYARGAFTSKDEKVKGTKRMVRRLIRKQLEKLMGRNLKYIVTGSAPLDVGVAQKIQSVGWTILEAYGVTENIVPMAANRLDCQKLGTVGKPFPANTIKISDDGEILVKGEGCISNYLHSSDSLLDEDGFYATGDLGRFDDEGFLVITGRKDSQFKTSTGRKIAPEMIENVYRQCDLVGDILVVGQGKKHLAALIVPSTSFWDTVRPMFTLDASREEIANSEAARLLLRDDLANAEGELKPHERIVEFHVIHREFDLRKGELTSSLKKRRRTIEANFRDEVEKMFCCDEPSQVRG